MKALRPSGAFLLLSDRSAGTLPLTHRVTRSSWKQFRVLARGPRRGTGWNACNAEGGAPTMTDETLIVAPVTITPTKPLTPTHVKGLLWTDVLVKASGRIADTRLVWNPQLAHLTSQTTAFWHYLDRTEPATDWSAESETAIGQRYLRFHRDRPAIPAEEL